MKIVFILLLSLATMPAFAQPEKEKVRSFRSAEIAFRLGKIADAYRQFQQLEPGYDTKDTTYPYLLWYYTAAAAELEKDFRLQEAFDSSLQYGLAALALMEKGIPYFDADFADRKYWMIKNIIVSYNGLRQPENAKKYKDLLYAAGREKKLPKGIDQYFNFSFFKWNGRNVWGYEWFEELPADRLSKSFSKVVYYIYSTNADGTDKEQLYRLHVLMFHKIDSSIRFDYVLTWQAGPGGGGRSTTLYKYTYQENIDYKKLDADIRELLKRDEEQH